MRTLEDYRPRSGLSIPCITCLDAGGEPIDADQRRLVRYLIQEGRGADVIFVMGTTGEWNRLDDQAVEFHRRVRAGYVQLMREEPGRWVRIDEARAVEEIQADIRAEVE